MKNNDKNFKSLLAIYAIILVVVVTLFVAIPFKKITASWISFAFCVISIVLGFFITIFAFKNDGKLSSKVYGFPVFKVGVIYVIAQFCVCLVVCILGIFIVIPSWIVLIISIIMLAMSAIGFIATDSARDILTKMDTSIVNNTRQMSLFNLDIASIIDNCTNPEIKVELEKLAEEIRYSDPVSSDGTKEIETQISEKIYLLKETVDTESNGNIKAIIIEIKNILSERNRICKVSKSR